MTSAIKLAKLYQPLPYFILYSKTKFACYSRYFLILYFCIPVPYNEKDIFFECQFQKVLQVFIEPFNFSFFSITSRGIDLDYRDIERFASEMNRDHFVIFEIASNYCISESFVDYDGYSISSKGFFPQYQIQWCLQKQSKAHQSFYHSQNLLYLS